MIPITTSIPGADLEYFLWLGCTHMRVKWLINPAVRRAPPMSIMCIIMHEQRKALIIYDACNGRKLVSEPKWTRVRPSLKQKSIIDYIITDAQLLEVSGNVHVDQITF